MKIHVVCKVIDNYGDAGFCLRLSSALCARGHQVRLFHDDARAFSLLYPVACVDGLVLIDAACTNLQLDAYPKPDLVIEPFGTSSEHTRWRFDLELKQRCPQVPWLVVDYLSAEAWVEQFHLSSSTNPETGHVCTYFYPGFSHKTGGLIHCDVNQATMLRPTPSNSKVFVFAYPNAPIDALIDCARASGQVVKISSAQTGHVPSITNAVPFVPQDQFDELLAQYDFLFVRGEDSFVRAQLLGKPFVWQVYPTPDGLHEVKLTAFLNRYLARCGSECALAVRNLWLCWNGKTPSTALANVWLAINAHWQELQEHALSWRSHLLGNPELVEEVLVWFEQQGNSSPK